MKLTQIALSTALVLIASTHAVAGDTRPASNKEASAHQHAPAMDPEMMKKMEALVSPGEHHKHMAALEGKWTTSSKMWMEPGGDPMVSSGTAEFSWILGGRYMQQDFHGEMMGQPFEGRGVIAHDNVSKEYVSTWIDTMGTGLMVERGTCSNGGKLVTSTGSYNDPMTGQATATRSEHKMNSNDVHTFSMYVAMADGQEMKMMEIVYTRAK